jgi:hypothetical protein
LVSVELTGEASLLIYPSGSCPGSELAPVT